MKLFVVVISVALVIMFVFATNTAAAPADYEETNDDMLLLTAPAGGIIPQVQVTGSNGNQNKMSSKHPLYVIVKTVVKLLMKMFSSENSL